MVLQIAALALSLAPNTFTTAQVQPCVWPNICVKSSESLVQVRPCVWPNICRETPAPAPVALAENEKPFTTCSLPNKCA